MRSAWSENINFISPHAFDRKDEIATKHWAKCEMHMPSSRIIHEKRVHGSDRTTDSMATIRSQHTSQLKCIQGYRKITTALANIYLLASKISLHANCSHRRRGTIKINIYLGHTLFHLSRTIFHTPVFKCNTSDENLYTQHGCKLYGAVRMAFVMLQAVSEAIFNVFSISVRSESGGNFLLELLHRPNIEQPKKYSFHRQHVAISSILDNGRLTRFALL